MVRFHLSPPKEVLYFLKQHIEKYIDEKKGKLEELVAKVLGLKNKFALYKRKAQTKRNGTVEVSSTRKSSEET